MTSLEGIEEAGEESVFARLFEAVDWLLANQTIEDIPTIGTRAKSALFSMVTPPLRFLLRTLS
jgi:hypothetical protein